MAENQGPPKISPQSGNENRSWIFLNFKTRDPENRFFHKFKKSLSGVFSLKRMKKVQNFQESDFFVFLIDFRVRSPGHSR